MKSYVITDRSTENTKYYAGLNGWVNLPENAVWYKTKKNANDQIKALGIKKISIEKI